ncbi:MAG: hypothetical protein AB1758_37795 [Candidatus Eremiobacterota bacterium]
MERLGMIARWKPVHLGHAAVLQALVSRAREVLIGIGSSNKYDASNPFTAAETAEMIGVVLSGATNFRILEVPDLGHGPRWRAMVTEMFGPLDAFVTANEYVRSLLESDYRVFHPMDLVPPHGWVRVDGTMVRRAMARGENWRDMVPALVAGYLQSRGLVDRLVREFGEELR